MSNLVPNVCSNPAGCQCAICKLYPTPEPEPRGGMLPMPTSQSWVEYDLAVARRVRAAENKMCVGFQDEVDRLKAKVADLEKERDAANAKLYSAELATSQHEFHRAVLRGDGYYEELKTLRAKVAAIETLLHESRLIADNNAAQRDDSTRMFIVATNERDELKAKVAELEADNRSLADRCRDKANANGAKEDKILDLEEEVESLKAEVETRGKLAETLRKEAASFKAALGQIDHMVELRLYELKSEISNFRKESEISNFRKELETP